MIPPLASRFETARSSREPRYPYQGSVRLLVPFDPWRLLLTLRGVDLSNSGLAALWTFAPSSLRDGQVKDGPEAGELFIEGDAYDLQLDHDADHLPAPFLRARLVRRERAKEGWTFAFAFDAPDEDLLSLVHELGERSSSRERHL